MKKQTLHDIAKLLAGVVLVKIFFLWRANAEGLFPIIFNLALFWVLIHYGWNVGKIPTVREKTYLSITGVIFAIVALLHLSRLFFSGLDFIVFGWPIPPWFSWIGIVLAGFLSYMSFRIRKQL